MPCSKATVLLSLPSLKGTFVFLHLFKLPRAGLVNILSVGYSSGKLTKGNGQFFPQSCNPWHLVPASERDSGSKHLPGRVPAVPGQELSEMQRKRPEAGASQVF